MLVLHVLMISSFDSLLNNRVIFFVSVLFMCDPDEGAFDPELRLPAGGRWRLPSPEEAAAGTHGLCRGKKIMY